VSTEHLLVGLASKGGPVADPTPFDILTDRYLPYRVDTPDKARDELVAVIRATLASERETPVGASICQYVVTSG